MPPSMALSIGRKGDLKVAEQVLPDLIRELLARPIASNEIWNVNLPPCGADEIRGVLYDRLPANAVQQMRERDIRLQLVPLN